MSGRYAGPARQCTVSETVVLAVTDGSSNELLGMPAITEHRAVQPLAIVICSSSQHEQSRSAS